MSDSDTTFDQLDDSSNTDDPKYILKDSIMFVLDASPTMFENQYFDQCLKSYQTILRQKCLANRTDKMGLVIFGTNVSNCEFENVNVLQELDATSLDGLKNIQSLCVTDYEKYQQNASDTKYPLYDVLTYSLKTLQSSKTTDTTRNIIILCTCISDPVSKISIEEQRKLESLIATFKDNDIEFFVIGLSEKWNDEVYYKDIQTVEQSNYKLLHLQDLENYILNPARKMMTIPWEFSSEIEVDVTIFNIYTEPQIPAAIMLNKDDNSEVVKHNVLVDEDEGDNDSEEKELEEESICDEEDVMFCVNSCGSDFYFTPKERKIFKNLGLETKIKILAFKPVKCDPLYHVQQCNFVTISTDCNHDAKIFFKAFVSRCLAKKVMAVCALTTTSNIQIVNMIPSEDDGGFYMHIIPYDDYEDGGINLECYVHSSEKPYPENTEATQYIKDLIEQSKMEFDPKLFKDPELAIFNAHIEALALGKPLKSLPMDTLLSPLPQGNVEDIVLKLKHLLHLEETEEDEEKFENKRFQTQEKSLNKKVKHDDQ